MAYDFDAFNEEPIIDLYKSPIVYSLAKTGKVLTYQVRAVKEGNLGIITMISCQLNGVAKHTQTFVKAGKNKGKANATTLEEQTILEAKAKFEAKFKEGYKTIEEIKQRLDRETNIYEVESLSKEDTLDKFISLIYNHDHNNQLQPMLAKKYSEDKINWARKHFWQPKLNGVRCRATRVNDRIVLFSRDGEVYSVPHIELQLTPFVEQLGNGEFLDGELYIHGSALQDTVSLVKRYRDESKKVEFWVYDIGIKFSEFTTRWQILRNKFVNFLVNYIDEVISIKLIETIKVSRHEDVVELSKNAVSLGYEGGMLRVGSLYYDFGFRSDSLLKIKFDQSEDFEILGATLPDSGIVSDFTWSCITPQGKNFEVRPHGTIQERMAWFHNRHNYIGKKLQLSFFEYTNDGIPFHITSVTVRDYE